MKRADEYTAPRAARLLDVNERTVRRWCNNGRLKTGRRDPLTGRYFVGKGEIAILLGARRAIVGH